MALTWGRRLFSINTEDTRKQSFSMETYPRSDLICVCILLKSSRYTEAATTSFSFVIFADSLHQPGQGKHQMMLGILWTFSLSDSKHFCKNVRHWSVQKWWVAKGTFVACETLSANRKLLGKKNASHGKSSILSVALSGFKIQLAWFWCWLSMAFFITF